MKVRFCNLEQNFTLAVKEMRRNRFIYVEDNQIKGILGHVLNKYLGLGQKKYLFFS